MRDVGKFQRVASLGLVSTITLLGARITRNACPLLWSESAMIVAWCVVLSLLPESLLAVEPDEVARRSRFLG